MGGTKPTLIEMLQRIEDALTDFLVSQRPELNEGAIPLLDEICRLIGLGGKRLRPQFCYWGYIASGGRDGAAITKAACALEFVHTFAIIQDDVMDKATLRRGGETTWLRLGINRALLAADLSTVLADRLLEESGFTADLVRAARKQLDKMRLQTIGGQNLELESSSSIAEEEALRIGYLKSGRYTVTDPLAIGAALARRSLPQLQAFGFHLGRAFQLRDDINGILASTINTGKDEKLDLAQQKPNVLMAIAFRLDPYVLLTRESIEKCGAVKEAESLFARESSLALDAIKDLPDSVRTALALLARLE